MVARAFAQSRASWGSPMSRLGQQMFMTRKNRTNVATAEDIGHEGVITRRDGCILRSHVCSLQGLICDAKPQGVDQSERRSTYLHSNYPQL